MIMSTVGRGGEGDVGQRIRDEILVIQVHMNFVHLSFVSINVAHTHSSFFLYEVLTNNGFWL